MKLVAAVTIAWALIVMGGCNQSPQHLVEAGNRYHARQKYQEASILYRKAIAKDRTFADAYYREGLNLLDQKNPVEAARFFRKAVDLNPNNTDAEVKLSEIYLTAYAYDQKKFQKLLPEVRELTAKILAKNLRDFHGVRLQAFLYLADRNLPKALEEFQLTNEIQPYSPEVVGWLAQTLTASGQWETAEKLMRDMIAHDKTWGPAYDFLFVQYLQRKRPADAEAVLKQRVGNDPKSDVALVNYSNYLLETNRYQEAEGVIRRALNDPKAFPKPHMMVGDFYMRANRTTEAENEYRAGAGADSKDQESYELRLVQALARDGASDAAKRGQAIELARKMVNEHPKDAAPNQVFASLLLDTGTAQDVAQSLNELKKLVSNNNNDPVLHFDLARAYYKQKDLDKAQAEAAEAVRLNGSLLAARVLLATVYEDRGQHGKALDEAGAVLEKQPGNAEAALVRATALVGSKDLDRARQELEALVKRAPQYSDAAFQLARLYVMEHNYPGAQAQYQRLWEGLGGGAQPDLRGFIGLQEVKLRQGHADEAVRSIQDLVKKNPGNAAYLYTLANFQADAAGAHPAGSTERANLLKQAESSYQEVLKKAPGSAEALLRLGTIQRMLNDNAGALASYEKVVQVSPSNAEAHLNRAMILEAMGEKDKARQAYNQTLGVDPDNVVALNNLAFLNADNDQNLDQAMTYAERAKKRMPENASVSDTLGYVYFRKHLTEDAIRELKLAVDKDPKSASFRYHLAMALLQRGDKAGARREAEAALRTASSDEQQKIKTFVSEIG